MPSGISPIAPLVVRSDDGVVLFASIEAARGYLEVPDVEAGVYGPAFDAEGRLLNISLPAELLEKKPRGRLAGLRWRAAPNFNPVCVELAEGRPNHRTELLALLRSALAPVETDSLERLVVAAADRFGVIGD